MNEMMDSVYSTNRASRISSPINSNIMNAAQQLEATFISEMLKSTGIGKTPSSFGGGAGEDQFGSFLRDIQAKEIAKSGGIGLATQLYRSMSAKSDE